MSQTDPQIRKSDERETLSGILGAIQKFGDWIYERPKRAGVTLIGLFALSLFVPVLLAIWNPEKAFAFADTWNKRDLTEELRAAELRREGEEVDRFIRQVVTNVRFRLFAARSVVRAYVFDRDREEQISGIVDVFESMDPLTQKTGIAERPLPLSSINETLNYMSADPGNPRCIAANTEDYDDPELRAFLSAGGLKASAACPISDRTGRVIGLLAVSARSPLEANPEIVPRTRDAALMLGGYMERSPAVKRATDNERKKL